MRFFERLHDRISQAVFHWIHRNPRSLHVLPIRVEYKLIHPGAQLPKRANPHDAASDLYAVEDTVIAPGETRNVNTGLIFAVPSGAYTTINGRSSLNKQGVLAFRGVIDAGYVGELKVCLTNTGREAFHIRAGERVGQITVHRRVEYETVQVENFSAAYSMRGTRGFGSSGR